MQLCLPLFYLWSRVLCFILITCPGLCCYIFYWVLDSVLLYAFHSMQLSNVKFPYSSGNIFYI